MEPTFDERAAWFDQHYGTTRGRIRKELVLERIVATAPPPPARVLDAGGGPGAIAVPLAHLGYDVTLLDPSIEMLEIAAGHARDAGVSVATVQGEIALLPSTVAGPFDLVCCHAVLLYLDEPLTALRNLRAVARPGATLSMLEKNREALSVRPGLIGEYDEAIRVLDDPVATGNLGISNRSRTVDEWHAMLLDVGWRVESWVGVRFFSDLAPDDLGPSAYEALLRLEREAGRSDPYRRVSRLFHIAATAV